jgi:hypothetical protein
LLGGQIFLLPETIIFFFRERFATPVSPSFCAGVPQSSTCQSKQLLNAQTKFSYPHQDFFSWRQSPGNILAHKAGDVGLNS